MVFGMVGVNQTYLNVDESRRLVQRRGNTDVAKHDFGNIRSHTREFDHLQGCRLQANANANRLANVNGNNSHAPGANQKLFSVALLNAPMYKNGD
jgi:hypothetical protein